MNKLVIIFIVISFSVVIQSVGVTSASSLANCFYCLFG